MSDLAAVAALGTTPIAGANPAGASARYEPEFEKLAGEIAKLESVEGRGSIKWDVIVECGIALLSGKTKDLLVSSYLTLGLLQEDGYPGLAAGLTACKDMLNTFWENVFPEKSRLRARAQALQWMAERVTPALRERSSASKSDKDSLTAAVAALGEIATLAGQKFEEGGPSFGEFQSAVQDKLYSVPADDPPPSSEPAPSSESSGSSSSSEAPPPPPPAQREIDSPDAAREVLNEMKERRLKAATVLREANPADPFPYRLLRAVVWEDLLDAPAAKDGLTEQSGGDAAFAGQMEEKLEKGEYAGVIGDCESKLAADRLWLDSNFYLNRAMEGLGKPYAAARRAVAAEVVKIVRACPALLDLKFSDGTPMAGEPTKLWILHELAAMPAKTASPAGALETALAEARKLVARKNFPEAAALLQKELRLAPNRRDRFLGRLYLAKLCAEAGRLDLALPQLEGLDEEGRKFALEEWEPSLAAEIARELWRCHKASATPEKAAEFYGRLCRLDLGAALAVDGKK
ncbi:MAG: type VI secretion system protein TssA [Planctomycetaceae bacterium]|nr:type VI secretion system protein TssA [Planctomycetaceae bacterium]